MKTHDYRFRLTFIEECLGTASANPELYRDFIASKRPEGPAPDEVAALPPVEEELQKAMTVFSRNKDGKPILWDYQIRGFFKDSCGALSRVGKVKEDKSPEGQAKKVKTAKEPSNASAGITAYKKIIDGLIFVKPREIVLNLPADAIVGVCERPLRAQTAQGERVALARSETVPAGTTLDFEVCLMDDRHIEIVLEWLGYGCMRGLGQWRNSGKGAFTYELLKG
jgi:hypothetical protein